MVSAGHDFVAETSSTERRARAIRAARNLLSAVARMLIMADMVDVRVMLLSVSKVLSSKPIS